MGFDELEEEFLDAVVHDPEGVDDEHPNAVLAPVEISPEERKHRREVMDKRSGKDLERKWQQQDRATLAEAEALSGPPVITAKNCDTCQSPHRLWIDRKLVQGWSHASIARYLEQATPDEKTPSRKSIGNHYREHLAFDQAAVRAIMEEEALAIGQNIEEGVRGAFTLRGSLEVLIRKAFQDAQDGVTTVEPRDLIQMIKLLNDLNSNSGAVATEEARTAIAIWKEAVQTVLLKGDTIDRETGIKVLLELEAEIDRLKAEQTIEGMVERHLELPVEDAEVVEE